MKKSEIVSQLATQFYRVGSDMEDAETNPVGMKLAERDKIKWKTILVYEVDGDVMIRRKIGIYVANEGTDTEQAFYMDKVPGKQLVKPPVVEPLEPVLPKLPIFRRIYNKVLGV